MMLNMSDINHNIKRIIINIDSGGFSASIMESAVILASRLQANLCGLFIEDTELLQLANLPFTREITLHTALFRDLSSSSMERNLNAIAAQMRQTLEEMATISDVGCSFRTVRGPRLESVIKESEDSQLILIMPKKRLTENRYHAKPADKSHPIVLFYDGSLQAHRAVRVIKSMNNTHSVMKRLLVLTTSQAVEDELLEQLPVDQFQVKCLHLSEYNISDIIDLVRTQTPGLVILPMENILLKQEGEVRRLLDMLSCLLILVR
jgi:hypothetical protein